MLSAFLGHVTGYFDRRFLFNVWFPSFLFGAAAVATAALVVGPQIAVEAWSKLPVLIQIWLGIGALVLVTFFAYICDNLLGSMVRIYEGYWPEWLNWLRHIRIEAKSRRWQYLNERMDLVSTQKLNVSIAISKTEQDAEPNHSLVPESSECQVRLARFHRQLSGIPQLNADQRARTVVALFEDLHKLRTDMLTQDQADGCRQGEWETSVEQVRKAYLQRCRLEKDRLDREFDRLYALFDERFPRKAAHLMPTDLGNVMRAAESYSKTTYNFDAVLVWPRLVQQLPNEFESRLEQSSTPLTTLLFSATLSFLFAIVGGLVLFFVGQQWWLFVGAIVCGLLVSVGCYNAAVHRAVAYGMLIRSAFDLYRHELLKALQVPLPPSPKAEWSLWPQIEKWWYHHTPPLTGENEEPLWYYEGRRPASSDPERSEHVVFLQFGAPPSEGGKND